MKELSLSKKRWADFKKGNNFFYETDIEEGIKSCHPGQWCTFNIENKKYIGFVNPFSIGSPQVTIIDHNKSDPLEYIKSTIIKAISYRRKMGYAHGARLVHGFADGLPGLIVDEYDNAVIVQINMAGMDIYRSEIKEILEVELKAKVSFLDNKQYRKQEGLPEFEKDTINDSIKITDMNMVYELPSSLMQKIGYYYDHRDNRVRFENTLNKINKEFTKGLDLFCYIGSWGLHSIRAGVKSVDFVDQANMESVVMNNLLLNNFEGKGQFVRNDVFDFLKTSITSKQKYDLIICDPPAFNKSIKHKKNSLLGYQKLYSNIFRILDEDSILVAASCTQNISLEELDEVVSREAMTFNRKIKVIDLGIQGLDHPINSLKSKSNYIKYLCYKVE